MSINRNLLFNTIKKKLLSKYHTLNFDVGLILYLIEKTIYNDPTQNCNVKGSRTDWYGLPKDKSLFTAKENCGLPIGNLTSQLFGNIYLSDFDHFVKRDLKIQYYGRYVDDFVLIHNDKDYLQSIISAIKSYLERELQLTLHPNKIYLQHFSKGVKYLGSVIKPYRLYIANRTKGNFYDAIQKQNKFVKEHKPSSEEIDSFIACMNSYLGILQHYKTYKFRKRLLLNYLSGWWWNHVYISGGYKKFNKKIRSII